MNKYIINTEVYFIGYLHIMDCNNARKMRHIKMLCHICLYDGITECQKRSQQWLNCNTVIQT